MLLWAGTVIDWLTWTLSMSVSRDVTQTVRENEGCLADADTSFSRV